MIKGRYGIWSMALVGALASGWVVAKEEAPMGIRAEAVAPLQIAPPATRSDRDQGPNLLLPPEPPAEADSAPAAETAAAPPQPAPEPQPQETADSGEPGAAPPHPPAKSDSPLQLRMEASLVSVEPPVDPSEAITPVVRLTNAAPRFALAPGDEVVGPGNLRYLIRGHETLVEMARAYDLGFNEVILANPEVDPWLPNPGMLVRLPFRWVLPQPDKPADVIINIPEMRLYHQRGRGVDTYPIGVGQEGWDTPIGRGQIVGKKENPAWYPPESIRKEDPSWPKMVPPGEDNPLGTHAIYLNIPGDYRIHGTNQPYGVGRRVSHGCIRLYPEDIIKFFQRVNVGVSMSFIDQPVKAGWYGDAVMLEIHPPLSRQNQELPDLRELTYQALERALQRRPQHQGMEFDWELVDRMVSNPDGIPRRISRSRGPGETFYMSSDKPPPGRTLAEQLQERGVARPEPVKAKAAEAPKGPKTATNNGKTTPKLSVSDRPAAKPTAKPEAKTTGTPNKHP